jgi:2-amino-4-hydroxy-6-hydroxymethyldihydropteridine diphosphokinase
MNDAWLLLGSNEGNRMIWMKKAMDAISVNCGRVLKQSAIYETAAWGINEQPDFLNMVVQIETSKTPHDLLTALLGIEQSLGRKRDVKWGQRIIDIDILFFNQDIIKLPDLTIPHPFIPVRRFTLAPLAEIASDYVHPELNKTVGELLAVCPDTLELHEYTAAG